MEGVTLIGMTGAGKSTIGKMLAEKLEYDFCDLDLAIEEVSGKTPTEILETMGRDAFLELEERCALDLDCNNTVIAPGGSIVYCEKSMLRFSAETTIIFLLVPIEEIRTRLRQVVPRAIVGAQHMTFEALYAQREPLYRQYADVIVEAHGRPAEAIAAEIERKL